MFSAIKKVDSWGSIQDAVASVRKRVAGPSRAERQNVLGEGSNEQRLDTLLQNWRNEQYRNVIVMAGAGISVAAGFPDFRDKENGVYARIQQKHGWVNPESLFTFYEYEKNPGPLCLWLQEFLDLRRKAVPTLTHCFLQLLEEKGCLLRCYTQNIDGLEMAAGLPRDRVVTAHGDMSKPCCVKCGARYDLNSFEDEIIAGNIPRCQKAGCGKAIRPDIVFFEEPTAIPHNFQQDFDKCDLLIILGTSLNVNPFANLACRVNALCPRLLINRDKVLINNCRHRSRQLRFDGPKSYRDVWLGGQCDESARLLAASLGWNADLLHMEARFRGGTSRISQTPFANAALTGLPSMTSLLQSLPKAPSISQASSSTSGDCISELSSETQMLDIALEDCCVRGLRDFRFPSSPSNGSVDTMVSELSCNDSDDDLDLILVDSGTGKVVEI
jgi:NAD-dependent deacetylase sirtuin 2